MLFSKTMIETAIKHFPRWMDIRKRYFSSNGGQILTSVAEETEEVQNCIDEYIKTFFLSYYEDKTNSICDFIYRANIGKNDLETIKILDPVTEITEDIKAFYENEKYAYYQEGFLFVKKSVESIHFSVDENVLEAKTEKVHVWNAYDEFAVFIGIERYEDETNEELFNRIIETSKRVLNSSSDGLKNSIISSLSNIIPEISIEDITLERPTADNLKQYYDDFNTIIDKLSSINKDVLRFKQWDRDLWSNDFKKIDYIPHVWDIILDNYMNGIGDNDDLKPMLIDNITSTDAELSFYEKSNEKIETYIKNSNLEENINLKLIKYNNVLNPLTAKYRITASEAIELNDTNNKNPIYFDLFKSTSGEHSRRIEELIAEDNATKNIEIVDRGLLTKKTTIVEGEEIVTPLKYRIKFLPKSTYNSMEIYECYAVNSSGIRQELKDSTTFKNFMLKGSTLYNNKVKKNITKISELSKQSNAIDTTMGITSKKMNEKTELVINTNNCENEMLRVNYNCQLSEVPENNIALNNFYYDRENSVYISDTVFDEKSLEITLKANQVTLNVQQGQCNITAIVNGKIVYSGPPIVKNNTMYFQTDRYNESQDITISIVALGTVPVRISNVSYSKYSLNIRTTKGLLSKIEEEDNTYYLPDSSENDLIITFNTSTQYAPYIDNIFIGTPLNAEDYYTTDIVDTSFGEYKLYIKSNCDVKLFKSEINFSIEDCNSANEEITVVNDYNTSKLYIALENDSYLLLDTSEYSNINKIYIDNGSYETIGIGAKQKHLIRLNKDQKIKDIVIDGTYNELIRKVYLDEILMKKVEGYNPIKDPESPIDTHDKVYITKLLKGLVIERSDNSQFVVNITVEDFDINYNSISKITSYNIPNDVQITYMNILSNNDEYVTIGSNKIGTFDEIDFYPKGHKEYVAINEYSTVLEHKENIEIINTFNNGFIDNKLMVYKVTPIGNSFSIKFQNDLEWSIGKKKIVLDFSLNYDENETFNYQKEIITDKVKLESVIPLKEVYIGDNKKVIELDQYNIINNNKNYSIVYKYDINNPIYDKAEIIELDNSGFTKLKYSNVLSIKYIGVYDNGNDSFDNEIDPNSYELINDKGIIAWKNKNVMNEIGKIQVIYSIKKAISIKINQEYLYDKVEHTVDAYNRIARIDIEGMKDGGKLVLTNPNVQNNDTSQLIKNAYEKSDVIFVKCKEPGFLSEKIEDTLVFKKVSEQNSIAVKTGWYYLFGREYYLFSSNNSKALDDDKYITQEEIDKDDGKLLFHKKTANYIKNSKMILNSYSDIYAVKNFNEVAEFDGISSLNHLTACDNYNYWNTFAMNLSLKNGHNGLGTYFKPIYDETVSYAFMEVTDNLFNENKISFYNPNSLKVYLGVSTDIENLFLIDTLNITNMTEINNRDSEGFYYHVFKKDTKNKYFIIVQGEGLLDDIVIQDYTKAISNPHRKNIDTLGLNIKEDITLGINTRLFISNRKGNKNNGTEIDSNGYIINSSNIDWNNTKIRKFKTRQDWMNNFDLENINVININDKDCIVTSGEKYGKMVSKPLYVGDPKIISSISYKINNLPLKNMQGFKTNLTQAQNPSSIFVPCKLKYNYTSSVNYSKDLIYPYVQLAIDMPQNKVIDSIEIYIEYKSNEVNQPNEQLVYSGEFISDVLDTYNTTNYKVNHIDIEGEEGDVEVLIRASREGSNTEVWTDWKTVENGYFEYYRFFQFKVNLNGSNSKVKINYIDLGVVN